MVSAVIPCGSEPNKIGDTFQLILDFYVRKEWSSKGKNTIIWIKATLCPCRARIQQGRTMRTTHEDQEE